MLQAILRKITAIRCICYVAAQARRPISFVAHNRDVADASPQVGGALVGTIIAASLNWSTYADAGGGANGVGTTFGWREILTAEFMGAHRPPAKTRSLKPCVRAHSCVLA